MLLLLRVGLPGSGGLWLLFAPARVPPCAWNAAFAPDPPWKAACASPSTMGVALENSGLPCSGHSGQGYKHPVHSHVIPDVGFPGWSHSPLSLRPMIRPQPSAAMCLHMG